MKDYQNILKGNTPTRKKYKVRVWYKTDIDPSTLNESTTETLKLVFEVDYVQGDKVQPNPVRIISGTKGNLQPGDKVGIGETEDFYVVSSNQEKTVLLAKYNLKVGYWSEYDGDVPTSTPGYGLQSVDAIGYSGDTYYGTVAFSDSAYWDPDGNGLISPYNQNGASYDGNPKPFVYDSNSNIYQYISGEDGYVNKLKTMGAPSTITGRLLTYEEANAVQNVEDEEKSIILNGSTYWLGSAYDNYYVWYVSEGDFYYYNFSISSISGVRPVIEINTSDIG